ncbi:unnamed protein product, partial [Phaeothamnion confervicola]
MTRTVLALLLALAFAGGARAQGTAAPAPDEAMDLVTRAARLYGAGNCADALPLTEKAAALLRARDANGSADLGMALMFQGLCLKKLTRASEAERSYRDAIDIFEKVQGPNGRDLAVALDNLASLYVTLDRLKEAEPLRLRALQIFRSTLDPLHPSIATALGNLAVLYQFQG